MKKLCQNDELWLKEKQLKYEFIEESLPLDGIVDIIILNYDIAQRNVIIRQFEVTVETRSNWNK